MKLVTVVGARPQFVKASVVSLALQGLPDCEEILVHTGQHYETKMSRIFFEELGISEPAHNLEAGSGTHGQQTGRMLERVEQVLMRELPDKVLVYGDTNSTLAGALAAAKLHIPVAHVEAGMRSFNRAMPEELNRILTDHLSSQLLVPTPVAERNLLREGVDPQAIHLVGDVMYDAAIHFSAHAEARSRVMEELRLRHGEYVLCTIHRAENTDAPERLSAIFHALAAIAGQIRVVLPLHPRTRAMISTLDLPATRLEAVTLAEPAGYLDMLVLERHARCILTDSGGVQKEAFFQGVPCVTLRGETEWTELIESGWNVLAPPALGEQEIVGIVERQLAKAQIPKPDLYGSGNAAKIVAELLVNGAVRVNLAGPP